MKKVFLSIAIIGTAIGLQAQEKADKMVNFGVKAGLNIASQKAKFDGGSISADAKVGFHVGAFAEINVAEKIAIQPEVLFSTAGAKSGDYKTDLSYISVPVLVKYKISGFGVYLGPQVGFLIAAKDKYDGESEDVKDEYKSIDFAGVVGAEYTLDMGLGFNARYALGISNLSKDDEGDDYKVRNNIFQVGIHYRF